MTPPAFFDEGYDGSWLDALAFNPWIPFLLKDGNRAACNRAYLLQREIASLHSSTDSPGEEQR